MKKLLLFLTSLVSIVLLTGCFSKSQSRMDDEEKLTATLTIKFEGKAVSQKTSFEKDDSVMDILEDYHDVEEEAGMVTSIDGVSQDAGKNTYWMYDINGELAPKGAEEMTISEGDTIEFYLQTFE